MKFWVEVPGFLLWGLWGFITWFAGVKFDQKEFWWLWLVTLAMVVWASIKHEFKK